MITRIAVVADSHFDLASRWDDCLKVHDFIADDIARRNVSLVAHAGDVFDQKSCAEERNAVARWLTRCAETAPVFLVRGNHDYIAPGSDGGDLAIFRRLHAVKRIVVEEACGVHVLGGVAFAGLAWPRKAEILARMGSTASSESSSMTASDALRNVLRGFSFELAKHDGPKLLVAHAMIDGSKTDHDQPMVGCDMAVSVADLALARADFVAVGHVHAQQEWDFDGAPVVYPGAPRHVNYGEPGPKGYIVVEFDGPRLVGWERVATPTVPMLLIEAAWDGEKLAITSKTFPSADRVRGADVRLRYTTDSDRRDGARRAAHELRDRMLADGAALVKLEEQTTTTVRARVPEITTAKTLADKLDTLWRARAIEMPTARRARVFDRLRDLEASDPADARGGSPGRYDRIAIRGMGPFREHVEVNLAAIAGPLVAVVGENGAGKSSFLEILGGATTSGRQCPTRGSLSSLAVSRDAMCEVDVVNGAAHTIRHLVDNVSGKGESVVLDDAGRPRISAGKVREFDEWAREHLPAPEVLYASTFAAQGSTGFLGMRAGERKAVILRVLGIERLEKLAAGAREKAREDKGALDVIEARVRDEQARLGADWRAAPARAQADLDTAIGAATQADEQVARARAELDAARVESDRAIVHNRAIDEARSKRDALAGRLRGADYRLSGLDARIADGRALAARGPEIRAAVDRVAKIDAEMASNAAAMAKIEDGLSGDARRKGEIDRARRGLADRRKAAVLRADAADRRFAERAKIEEAAAAIAGLAEAATAAQGEVERLEADRARVQTVLLGGKVARIAHLRGALGGIADDPADSPADRAHDAITMDDTTERAQEQAPAELKTLEAALDRAKRAAKDARDRLATAERLAARAGEIASAAADFDAANTEIAAIDEEDEAFAAERAAIEGRRGEAMAKSDDFLDANRLLESGRPHWAQIAADLDLLTKIEAVLGELEMQRANADADRGAIEVELDAIGAIAEPLASVDLRPIEARVRGAEETARSSHARRAVAEKALADVTAAIGRIEERLAERARVDESLADWTRLAEDLGRDGIQALEIDAVGPELTTIANDLLRRCHGSRWTLRVDASKVSADGKKTLEACEVTVLDAERGREAPGETLSGGEKVIINEALALALTVVGCRVAGAANPTLVRDETSAALDPKNGKAYVAMLRQAAELVGAAKVFFVAHNPTLAELADARLHVAGGRVEINA